LDGVNLLPFLAAENKATPHDTLFWRFGPQKAVRKGKWKLVDWRDFDAKKQSGWQLYDLDADIGEAHEAVLTVERALGAAHGYDPDQPCRLVGLQLLPMEPQP
jgi:arylsulfatase A-like enzyme